MREYLIKYKRRRESFNGYDYTENDQEVFAAINDSIAVNKFFRKYKRLIDDGTILTNIHVSPVE